MDEKSYLVSQGLYCPHCKSDEVYYLGVSRSYSYTGHIENIVKCSKCGAVMFEGDLEEKEEGDEKEENSDLEFRAKI